MSALAFAGTAAAELYLTYKVGKLGIEKGSAGIEAAISKGKEWWNNRKK